MSELRRRGAGVKTFVRNTSFLDQSCGLLVATCLCLGVAACSDGPEEADWTHWAADPHSSRYSTLAQIDATNFERLEVAWQWRSKDVELRRKLGRQNKVKPGKLTFADFAGTPLEIAGVLYGVTSLSQVYALDAASGELLWLHDPEIWREKKHVNFPKHRGLAYWQDDADGGRARIFVATHDARLIALDPATGELVSSFGREGRVDLLQTLRAHKKLIRGYDYFQASPPAIFEDLVIVGGSVSDQPTGKRGTPGDLRAYDARTGELRWTFHTVPQPGEPGSESWEEGSASYSGAANAWAAMSVDSEMGLLYAATSTPTNDYYGGHRLGDNLYAETLLCLNARTGERVWHQQLVRHGLWDYDLAAAPNLVDVEVDGKPVRAVVQVTKQAMAYVFDRQTGEPVWPIEDRPVPASNVPGERAAATQRFPTKPPPFDRQGMSVEDLIDFTPELRAMARAVFDQYESGPVFTPPSLQGTLSLPGSGGGANWQGAGFDPETSTLFVPSTTWPAVFGLYAGLPSVTDLAYTVRLLGTPFLPTGADPVTGIPIVKPPWSRITAIDLESGNFRWQVPNGEGPRDHPLLRDLDLPPLGSGSPTCVIVTKSLLIAADGTGPWLARTGRPILRAFDKTTGSMVGAIKIPGRVRGCPMTYAHNGVQYIVLSLLPEPDPLLVALALPEYVK